MHLSVSLTSGEPIYMQLKEQIKNQVLAGQLRDGEPLPSIRGLAQSLNISVITTKRAYDELEQEGLVVSVAGKGTYVTSGRAEAIREIQYRDLEERIKSAIQESRSIGLTREELLSLVNILYGEERC